MLFLRLQRGLHEVFENLRVVLRRRVFLRATVGDSRCPFDTNTQVASPGCSLYARGRSYCEAFLAKSIIELRNVLIGVFREYCLHSVLVVSMEQAAEICPIKDVALTVGRLRVGFLWLLEAQCSL